MLLISRMAKAQDENRVGLVVDLGDGEVLTHCVSFVEEEVSGLEVIERSGLAVEMNQQAGGQAICQINDQGCPARDCFCACQGGAACTYWSYWHLGEAGWNYSAIGAGMSRVRDGMVEGWMWGPGSVTEAVPPPRVTFEDICSLTDDAATVVSSESVQSNSTKVAQTGSEPASSNEQNESVSIETGFGPYLSFFGILLFVIGFGWLALRLKVVKSNGDEN